MLQLYESNDTKKYELHKHTFHNLKLVLSGTCCKYGCLLSQFNLWGDLYIETFFIGNHKIASLIFAFSCRILIILAIQILMLIDCFSFSLIPFKTKQHINYFLLHINWLAKLSQNFTLIDIHIFFSFTLLWREILKNANSHSLKKLQKHSRLVYFVKMNIFKKLFYNKLTNLRMWIVKKNVHLVKIILRICKISSSGEKKGKFCLQCLKKRSECGLHNLICHHITIWNRHKQLYLQMFLHKKFWGAFVNRGKNLPV